MGYKAYAKAIGNTVKSATSPMCVGIIAPWGSGKSFLFELLKLECDLSVRMRKNDNELVQWFESDYSNCMVINKSEQIDAEMKQDHTNACCYRLSLLIPIFYSIALFLFRSFTEFYVAATILHLVRKDMEIIYRLTYRFFYNCWNLHDLPEENNYNDLEAQPLLLQPPTRETIIVNFNALIFNKTDELWVALIRELYRVVELRLRKSPEHPKIKNQKDYKLLWRVEKAIKLLIDYGGEDSLRLQVYTLIMSLLGILSIFLLKVIGLFNLWQEMIKIVSNVWSFVVSIIGFLCVSIPSLKLLYDTYKNAGTSRGDVIFAEASSSIKDKVGFMERVKEELNELFEFLNKYKVDTNIELIIMLFIDDLDRCTINSRNVMVLEAIQLLLNISGAPVIAFLAVDTRIIIASIETVLNKSLAIDEALISGHEYLEKIIQLPFCLPEPPREKIKTFIGSYIRPYKVDILFVARRLKTFLKCIKSFMDDPILNDDCRIEICEERTYTNVTRRVKMDFLYNHLKDFLIEIPSLDADRKLLMKAATLLTLSTLGAVNQYKRQGEVVADDFCHSILDALSNIEIVRVDADEKDVINNKIIDKSNTKMRNIDRIFDLKHHWTNGLIERYKYIDVHNRKNLITSILYDYNRNMERFSTLIPTEFIPFLNSFCSEVNRNPRKSDI